MSFYYLDPTRENDPQALPDVEVFDARNYAHVVASVVCDNCGSHVSEVFHHREDGAVCTDCAKGYYYAFGSPGCLWDSDPVGPFDTEAEALTAAREDAGIKSAGCENCRNWIAVIRALPNPTPPADSCYCANCGTPEREVWEAMQTRS